MSGRFCPWLAALLLTASCANVLGLEDAGAPALAPDGGAAGADFETATGGSAGPAGGEGGRPDGAAGAERGGQSDALAGAGPKADVVHQLTALSLSSGVLEPVFSSEVHDYSVRVGVSVPALSVTPEAASLTDVIQVNKAPVVSGTASDAIALALGAKTPITVTVANVSEAYTITVERASGLFDEAYVKASNARADDHFGTSVALSQGTLAVGAPLEDGTGFGVDPDQAPNDGDNSGAVYVYVKSATGWLQQAYLKASNPRQFDGFGSAVALSGDVLVVGAPGESSAATRVDGEMNDTSAASSGAAYVFHRVAGHWAERAYLKPSANAAASLFGSAVAVSGGTIVVGAPRHMQPGEIDSAGAAFVFDRLGEDWVETQELTASRPAARDQFGTSVAISARRIVVGAPGESSGPVTNGGEGDNRARSAGAAYIFDRKKSAGFVQTTYLKAANARADAYFGSSVAVDGGLVVVGSPGESSSDTRVNGQANDAKAPNSGAAYVFANTGPGSWVQAAYLKASNAEAEDAFGSAVALGQGVVAVGASGAAYGLSVPSYGEDSAATGINGKQDNEDAPQAGAVYLFAQAGKTWAQQAYVKASNAEAEDQFGSAVAVADGDLAVGAELEDSYRADDASDNTASASGAVYVRSLLAVPGDTGAGSPGLTALALADLQLDFSPTTFDYQIEALAETTSVSITAAAADPGAEITLTDLANQVLDMTQPLALQLGDNRFVVHVLSTAGDYTSYSLDVLRPLPVEEVVAVDAASPLFDVSGGMLWETYTDSSLPVSISGDTLVIGVPYDDVAANGSSNADTTQDTGAVYVFVRTAQGWQKQTTLKASNAAGSNFFGVAVALDGDTLVVGASGESSLTKQVNGSQTQNPLGGTQAGAAYVFVRAQGVWKQQAYLKAFNSAQYNYFGETVAIDGDRVVVGARGESSQALGVNDTPVPGGAPSSGAAYVFARDGAGHWSEEAYLKATNTRESQFFGTRVAVLGDTIAVTASQEGGGSSTINGDENLLSDTAGGGAVYTYRYRGKGVGSGWETEAYLKPPNYHINVDFGRSLALGENTLVVGATGDQSRARYVDGDEFDGRGGDYVSYNFDESLSGNGAVYVFERDAAQGDVWHKTAYLKASNSDGRDAFGRSVSLSGDYLAIGAPGESSSVVKNPDDNAAQSSGAAYLFHRTGSSWSQTSYVKASTPTALMGVGCSVGLDGRTLAVGGCRQPNVDKFEPKIFGQGRVFQF